MNEEPNIKPVNLAVIHKETGFFLSLDGTNPASNEQLCEGLSIQQRALLYGINFYEQAALKMLDPSGAFIVFPSESDALASANQLLRIAGIIEEYWLPCSWEVYGHINCVGRGLEDAKNYAYDAAPLPDKSDYLDGSFRIDEEDESVYAEVPFNCKECGHCMPAMSSRADVRCPMCGRHMDKKDSGRSLR